MKKESKILWFLMTIISVTVILLIYSEIEQLEELRGFIFFVGLILFIIFFGYARKIKPPKDMKWSGIKRKLPDGRDLIIRRK